MHSTYTSLKIKRSRNVSTLLEKLQLKDEKNLLIQGLPSAIEKQFVKLAFAKNLSPF